MSIVKVVVKMARGQVFTENEIESLEDKFIDEYLRTGKKPIRLLFRLYLRYWREFLLSSFFYLIKQAPVLFMPLVIAEIINAVEAYIVKGIDPMRTIISHIIFIGALLIINIPANAVYVRLYSKATRRVEAGLRGAMVKKLQRLSIPFHIEMQSGRIQSKLMNDVANVHTLSTQLVTTLPAVLVNIITAIVVVSTKSPIVLLFFLLCIPVNVALVRAFRKKINKATADLRKNTEKTAASLNDMEEMVQITRAHALENAEVKKMTTHLTEVANSGFSLDMIQAYFGSFLWVTIQLFQLGSLVFSSLLYINGYLKEIGDITLFQTYFNTLTWQVSSIIGMLPIITKGAESVSSIGEILQSNEVEVNEGKEKLDKLEGTLEFKDLSFSYEDNQPLISSFNLKIEKGQTVALVGESGVGKTTLVNLIIGFIHAKGGDLLIDGKSIEDIDLTSYRKHISIVPQNSVMFAGSIRENITYGIENVTDEQIKNALEASRMYDFVMSLPKGLDSRLDEHAANLSGGQRQRLSIARAIIRNPSLIILDEATSALDNVSEREIQRAINSLTEGKTTIVVAHRLSTIRNADKIVVIKDGKCIEEGTYNDLISLGGEFYKMHSASQN